MVTAEDWRRHLKGDMGSNLSASASPATQPYPRLGSRPPGAIEDKAGRKRVLPGSAGGSKGFAAPDIAPFNHTCVWRRLW
jgi:hypothetical protein